MSKDQTVRKAAAALQEAIAEAEQAGFRVNWPARPADLARIEISATGAARETVRETAAKAAPKAAPATKGSVAG